MSSHRSGNRLHLVHTGRFYDDIRTPAPLLRAIARLAEQGPIEGELRVTLVGTVVRAHQDLASRLGLDDLVTFTGRQSFADSAQLAADADVLLVIDAPAEESLFLPSKLVEYLPMNKPILALTPLRGASADLVRRLDYRVVAPDDETGIARAIEELIAAKRERRLTVSASHARVSAEYDIRVTTASLAEILARFT